MVNSYENGLIPQNTVFMVSTLDQLSDPRIGDGQKLSLSFRLQLVECLKEMAAAVGGRLRKTHRQSRARFDALS